MTIEHINKKKLHRLEAEGRIGYFLEDCGDEMRGQRGDYTDGEKRYHLMENGVCLICKK